MEGELKIEKRQMCVRPMGGLKLNFGKLRDTPGTLSLSIKNIFDKEIFKGCQP